MNEKHESAEHPEISNMAELLESKHVLAQAVLGMTERLKTVDAKVENIAGEVTAQGTIMQNVAKVVERLNYFVNGDKELQSIGLVERERERDARLSRVEERWDKQLHDMDERWKTALENAKIDFEAKLLTLTKSHWEVKKNLRDWKVYGMAIAFCITMLWVVAGDEIKTKIFNKSAAARP